MRSHFLSNTNYSNCIDHCAAVFFNTERLEYYRHEAILSVQLVESRDAMMVYSRDVNIDTRGIMHADAVLKRNRWSYFDAIYFVSRMDISVFID